MFVYFQIDEDTIEDLGDQKRQWCPIYDFQFILND